MTGVSPAGGPEDTAVDEVLAVNRAFYEAVEQGDLDALERLWCDDREAVCIHPGAPPVHGRSAVMRSWALVMAQLDYVQFFLTDVQVTVAGDGAAVTCTENVLVADGPSTPADPMPLSGGRAVAVNVFARTAAGWRLWLHQAAPVVSGDL